MEYVTKIVPLLWEVLDKNKKSAINVTTKGNEIIIGIWSGRRWKRFKGKNFIKIQTDIKQAYQLN